MGERSQDNHLISHIAELLSALQERRLDIGRPLAGSFCAPCPRPRAPGRPWRISALWRRCPAAC